MSKCIIVGGVKINNIEKIKEYISNEDFVIACDSGIDNCDILKITPSLIVGDFDSHEKPNMDAEIIVLPKVKDDTDTMFAAREAVKRGFTEVLLLGVIGERFDHTLANAYILSFLGENGVKGKIVDDYSEITYLAQNGENIGYISDIFSYFSVISIDGTAKGVSIKNAKYPLENAIIEPSHQYATSNEVEDGKTAEVSVENGKLLLIKVF